jgi:NAD(P)-dependent dehydrogenase (short-subunit alcohol dehydrogenase family)
MTKQAFLDLQGKVAVITGAHRGIGRATAARLAAGGARVVMADLPSTDLAAAARKVAEHGEVAHHAVDITREDSVKALVEFAMDKFGRIDVLDNNAAYAGSAADVDLLSMEADEWDRTFLINARGTMLMCKHTVAAMLKNGGGSIINISSGTAVSGHMYQTAYACSKGAINTLTKYIATQYGAHGIRCNAIAPGLIKTENMAASMPEPMQEVFRESKLVPRLGEPGDIAEMVAFLGSDRSAWITGQIYPVDGGFLAQAPHLASERRLMAQMHVGIGEK